MLADKGLRYKIKKHDVFIKMIHDALLHHFDSVHQKCITFPTMHTVDLHGFTDFRCSWESDARELCIMMHF